MSKITTNSIISRIESSSTVQTGTSALPKPSKTTPSSDQPAASPAPDAKPCHGIQQEAELLRSNRSRTRSTRAKEGGYDAKLAADKQRASRAARTRARNKKGKSSGGPSDTESVETGASTFEQETNQESQDTTRNGVKKRIAGKFSRMLNNHGTQTLIEVECAISKDPAYTTQSQEQSAEARFLPPIAIGTGSGFHLDHPAHRSGNKKTYSCSRGGSRTIAAPVTNHPGPNPPSPHESTEPEEAHYYDQYNTLPYPRSQEHLPLGVFPSSPTHDPNSPFLAYPDNQSRRTSCSPTPLDHHSQPSQSLGYSSEVHDGLSNLPLHANKSITHASTSSKSLGDPIEARPPASAHGFRPLHQSQLRRSSTLEAPALQLTPSEPDRPTCPETPTQPRTKRPLSTPETSLPTRKRPPTTLHTVGGKVYNGHLNITEINSQRVSTPRAPSQQQSRRQTAPPQTQRKGKGITSANSRASLDPQRTGNDNFDLLDDFDNDQYVVDRAKEGKLVKSRYSKPTAHDLQGPERSIWREVRDASWGFSITQGNFQSRSVFAGWVGACFKEVLKIKLPHLDPTTTTMSNHMETVILNNLCNARYQDLIWLREPVQNYFNLKNPTRRSDRQEIKDRINEINPNWFHYKNLDDHTDPYEGDILPLALESLFFYGPSAIGAKYPSLFERSDEPEDERKHLAVLAYLATMIQFCLSEWAEGYFKKGTLNATTQHSVWLCHFDGLKNVSLVARKPLVNTYNRWALNAYDASQAQKKFGNKHYAQAVVLPKDVRPDSPSRSPSPDNHE